MKNIDFATFKPAALSIMSILFSLMAGSLILLAVGKNPLVYFGLLFTRGMGSSLGIIETIIKMIPLLIEAAKASLIRRLFMATSAATLAFTASLKGEVANA